jgi:hypothetical protein
MSQFIKTIRATWEKGLTPLAVIDQIHNEGRVLVVLEKINPIGINNPNRYHCHRYFKVGTYTWAVSVDRQAKPLADVWGWLSKPRAKPPADEEDTETTGLLPTKGMPNHSEDGGPDSDFGE